jgi:phosphatidate cytidylyltransferase
MPLNVPVFYKRTTSAIVFGVIMLAGLLWNEYAFLVLVCLINILCLRDYIRLMQKIDKETYWPKWLPVVIQTVGLLLIFVVTTIYLFDFYALSFLSVFLVAAFLLCPAILFLVSTLSKQNSLAATLESFGGIFYITLPMLLLLGMRRHDMVLPLALILMIWSNDTLAYLVGSFIGKHPFSPISPNKTWEGTIGGASLTIIAAGIYGYFSHTYRFTDWMMLALCATVAGTFGDLLESKLKRIADVKDSGTLMPGHGGALDRFDSLLIATPFAFVYAIYFMR